MRYNGAVKLFIIADEIYESYGRGVEHYGNLAVIPCNEKNFGLLAIRNRDATLATVNVVAFVDGAITNEA